MYKKRKWLVILLVFITLIVLPFMALLSWFTFHGINYLENKYGEHFKVTSIQLPYYKNDADFFDLPNLYKKGEFVPFTLYCSDGNKRFTVIYSNGDYYDDYQLEDIHRYAAKYIERIIDSKKVQCVLFNQLTDYPCYDYYYPLLSLLSTDNRLWTQENVDELVEQIMNRYNGNITIIFDDSFNNPLSLKNETKRIEKLLIKDFNLNESNSFDICFTNYSLSTQRIASKNISRDFRFDYFGFNSEQKIISYNELQSNKNQITDNCIIDYN